MKNYAVLDKNGKVDNIIVASSLEVAESVTSSSCVFIPIGTFVAIGYSYLDGAFSAPVEETPA